MRVIILLVFIFVAVIATITRAQDYQDYADGYEQDNLYENYAQKQQDKVDGGGGYVYFGLLIVVY